MCSSLEEASAYTEEVAEIARMKEECLEMIQDAFEKVDALIAKIESILHGEVEEYNVQVNEVAPPNDKPNLSLDEPNAFMHSTQKFGS